MRTILKLAAAFGLAACMATSANAQGGRGGMGMGMGSGINLLSNKSVQKELKLTDEQIEKADKAATEMREKMTEKRQELQGLQGEEMREKMTAMMKEMSVESKKITDALLKPEQAKRFAEISLQSQGFQAYMDPEIQTKLKMTDEQKSKLKDLQAASMEKMASLREEFQNDREGAMKKMTEARKELAEKGAAMLTDDQKKMWKEMVGEPFTIVQQPRRPGGNN